MDKRLTWNEYKAAVDAKLAESGYDGDVEIHYIDSWKPDASITLSVYAQEEDRVPRLYVE